jgi:peptidoglycan-associated lipoprotein
MIALLMVVPGLLFTASCAKQSTMRGQAGLTGQAGGDDTGAAGQETEAQAETAGVDEDQLKASEAERQKMMARNRFVNEDVYFDFDKATLTPTAQNVLMFKADWLKANADESVTIEGHCDERGTPEYNLALGERRAQSAKSYLTNLGVDAARMQTISYGEERPVDPGSNEEAWAKNRRAHFSLQE